MLVSTGLKQFGRRAPETNGASIAASTIITILLFAGAFAAMRTVGRLTTRTDEASERPVVVALTPPEPPEPTVPPPRSTTAPPRARIAQPAPIAPPRGIPAPVTEPSAPPRDTATVSSTPTTAPRTPATIPIGIAPLPSTLADTAMGTRGGAPGNGAAVSVGDQTANTARFRDSIANARMRETARAWMRHEATGREKREIETSQRAAAKVAERTTSSGNSRDLHISQGKGINGVGAVGGGINVGLPLFSSGPSAEQRRRNDSLDAEYQLRLRRLQDRIIARRDSARLDSLRRDSLSRRPRSPFLDSRSPVARLVQRPLQLSAP